MWKNFNPYILWWECKSVGTMGNSMEVLQKMKMELPYHPAIPLQGIYLKKPKTLT